MVKKLMWFLMTEKPLLISEDAFFWVHAQGVIRQLALRRRVLRKEFSDSKKGVAQCSQKGA